MFSWFCSKKAFRFSLLFEELPAMEGATFCDWLLWEWCWKVGFELREESVGGSNC